MTIRTGIGVAALVVWSLLHAPAYAQDTDAPEPDAPGAAEEAPAPETRGGDIIYLKSGTVMSGVQVLRSTPLYYEVQIIEGVDPMQLPRRQVERVEYDDIDPLRDQLEDELFGADEEVTIASGEQVTSELRDKLMNPVTEEPLRYRNEDFVTILQELRDRLGVHLRIHPSIQRLPAARRQWTVEIPPDKTLMTLLREDLVGQFPYAEVIFDSDHIIVMTKKAAKERTQDGQ